MSAIAIVLAEMGHARQRQRHPRTRRCSTASAPPVSRCTSVTSARHVHGRDAITWSARPSRSATSSVDEAAPAGVPSLHRSGMLASICAQAKSLGVAGTHGKTSTTSMLMLILAEAGLRPSFVIGGDVTDMGTGAQWTGGEWLVVEADESDGTHLQLPLHGTILTNVEVDHLDYYGTVEAIFDGFDRYLAQIAGPKVLCIDDPRSAAAGRPARRHHLRHVAERRLRRRQHAAPSSGSFTFDVVHHGAALGTVSSAAAWHAQRAQRHGGAGHGRDRSGCRSTIAAAALGQVRRRRPSVRHPWRRRRRHAGRRLRPPAQRDRCGARRGAGSGDGWRRVVAVFQPNRFNRMAVMWPDYRDAFVDADVVVLTDIFASGTDADPRCHRQAGRQRCARRPPEHRLVWMPRRADLIDFLARELRDGDVCISMGCGDIASLPDEVQQRRNDLRVSAG